MVIQRAFRKCRKLEGIKLNKIKTHTIITGVIQMMLPILASVIFIPSLVKPCSRPSIRSMAVNMILAIFQSSKI